MSNLTNESLWLRLDAMSIDDADARLPFSRRLARDNDWTHAYALKVIDEYKRFVYLAMVAGHPVTPSDEVDQAWHLHLAYTRQYWGEMCDEILGTPLHHGPTRGGNKESAKYFDWYERTLESYASEFGHEPPRDVWPPLKERFGGVEGFRRIDTRKTVTIPRSRAQAVTLGLLAVVLAGCTVIDAIGGWSAASLLILLLVILIWLWRGSGGGKGGDGGFWGGCAGCSSCGGCGGCS